MKVSKWNSKIFKRYLLIEVKTQQPIHKRLMYSTVINLLCHLFGEFGLAAIEPRSIVSRGNLMIISCRRGAEHKVRCAVLMMTSISGIQSRARTLKVSGTLKCLKAILKKSTPNDLLRCRYSEPKELKRDDHNNLV